MINIEAAEPQQRRQILRELSVLKICESPHIVSFYGAFMDDINGDVVICMEYCEGGSFDDIYKRAHELHGVIGETVLARLAESVNHPVPFSRMIMLIHIHTTYIDMQRARISSFKKCDPQRYVYE